MRTPRLGVLPDQLAVAVAADQVVVDNRWQVFAPIPEQGNQHSPEHSLRPRDAGPGKVRTQVFGENLNPGKSTGSNASIQQSRIATRTRAEKRIHGIPTEPLVFLLFRLGPSPYTLPHRV